MLPSPVPAFSLDLEEVSGDVATYIRGRSCDKFAESVALMFPFIKSAGRVSKVVTGMIFTIFGTESCISKTEGLAENPICTEGVVSFTSSRSYVGCAHVSSVLSLMALFAFFACSCSLRDN